MQVYLFLYPLVRKLKYIKILLKISKCIVGSFRWLILLIRLYRIFWQLCIEELIV